VFAIAPRHQAALVMAGMLAAWSTAGAAPAKKPAMLPRPPGCDPAALRRRLAALDSADIARACGNISAPWAYRGPFGREQSLRSYGRHHADSLHARAIAGFLLASVTIDTAYKMPSVKVECTPAAARPIYLLSLHGRGYSTYALLRFDIEAAVFFDAEEPLGLVRLGDAGDSLWAALGELMPDDPLLRSERPRLAPQQARPLQGDTVFVEELPKPIRRVPPVFPPVAIQMDLSGVVLVQALIGKDGEVKDAYVVSGHPVLRDDALEAVWQWKFKPAMAKGEPVPVWVSIPVRFTMR
jgi:protein TonB